MPVFVQMANGTRIYLALFVHATDTQWSRKKGIENEYINGSALGIQIELLILGNGLESFAQQLNTPLNES